MQDQNIFDFLLNESFIRKQQPMMCNQIRAMANMICRFLEPLKLGAKTTSEILVPKNGDALLKRLVDFGGIKENNQNSNAFIQTVSFI
jgi:hypothetical protein